LPGLIERMPLYLCPADTSSQVFFTGNDGSLAKMTVGIPRRAQAKASTIPTSDAPTITTRARAIDIYAVLLRSARLARCKEAKKLFHELLWFLFRHKVPRALNDDI
jgi:hypothetical protein